MLRPSLSRRPPSSILQHVRVRGVSTPSKTKPITSTQSAAKHIAKPISGTQSPISVKSLNAFVVSQSSAGGSRDRVPPKFSADHMSPQYRDRARKITLAMIAAPIAIVMSYMLAMRVWGGKERLVKPISESKTSEDVDS